MADPHRARDRHAPPRAAPDRRAHRNRALAARRYGGNRGGRGARPAVRPEPLRNRRRGLLHCRDGSRPRPRAVDAQRPPLPDVPEARGAVVKAAGGPITPLARPEPEASLEGKRRRRFAPAVWAIRRARLGGWLSNRAVQERLEELG